MSAQFGSCKTCRNYSMVGTPVGANGECRGGTPQAVLIFDQNGRPVDKLTYWPQPQPDKWCAEFTPNIAVTQ